MEKLMVWVPSMTTICYYCYRRDCGSASCGWSLTFCFLVCIFFNLQGQSTEERADKKWINLSGSFKLARREKLLTFQCYAFCMNRSCNGKYLYTTPLLVFCILVLVWIMFCVLCCKISTVTIWIYAGSPPFRDKSPLLYPNIAPPLIQQYEFGERSLGDISLPLCLIKNIPRIRHDFFHLR